jgi:hypothetical protein
MNDEEKASGLDALNEYATQDSSPSERPASMDGLVICRWGVKVRIPAHVDSWAIYHRATDYLNAFMDIAAYNDNIPPRPIPYQEVIVHYVIDSDCNRYTDFCEIKMQRFYKKP